jgi:hypothetical protein
MAAGVRNMPSAIDSPVTTAIVPANPICLRCSIETTSYADSDEIGIHRMVEMVTILSRSKIGSFEQVVQTTNSKPTIAVGLEQHGVATAGVGLTVIVGEEIGEHAFLFVGLN